MAAFEQEQHSPNLEELKQSLEQGWQSNLQQLNSSHADVRDKLNTSQVFSVDAVDELINSFDSKMDLDKDENAVKEVHQQVEQKLVKVDQKLVKAENVEVNDVNDVNEQNLQNDVDPREENHNANHINANHMNANHINAVNENGAENEEEKLDSDLKKPEKVDMNNDINSMLENLDLNKESAKKEMVEGEGQGEGQQENLDVDKDPLENEGTLNRENSQLMLGNEGTLNRESSQLGVNNEDTSRFGDSPQQNLRRSRADSLMSYIPDSKHYSPKEEQLGEHIDSSVQNGNLPEHTEDLDNQPMGSSLVPDLMQESESNQGSHSGQNNEQTGVIRPSAAPSPQNQVQEGEQIDSSVQNQVQAETPMQKLQRQIKESGYTEDELVS
jgi:hypothetical protein